MPAGPGRLGGAGPGGVEVLEFRMVSSFVMDTLDQDLAKWQSFAQHG